MLGRSNLEHLHVICTDIDSNLYNPVAHVLGSLRRSTLESLKLLEDHIDDWIHRWMSPQRNPYAPNASKFGLQLLQLHLQDVGYGPQKLSRTSALFVHDVIYWKRLVEVHLESMRAGGCFLQ